MIMTIKVALEQLIKPIHSTSKHIDELSDHIPMFQQSYNAADCWLNAFFPKSFSWVICLIKAIIVCSCLFLNYLTYFSSPLLQLFLSELKSGEFHGKERMQKEVEVMLPMNRSQMGLELDKDRHGHGRGGRTDKEDIVDCMFASLRHMEQ